MLVQKTVYFREEDIPKWEKIKNKAEWLHEALKREFKEQVTKEIQAGTDTFNKESGGSAKLVGDVKVEEWSGPLFKKNGKL